MVMSTMKETLVTGATGFVGGYLVQELLKDGNYSVHGTYRSEESKASSPVGNMINLHKADLLQPADVEKVLEATRPEFIFHLAAQAAIAESFRDPAGTLHNNIDGLLVLFESLLKLQMLNTKVLVVLSADVYGYVRPEELPIKEDTLFRPGNPYAVSKAACDLLAFQYWRAKKLPIIRVRPFTHIGPGQKTGFVTSDFAKQVAEIEKGKQEPTISVGNLDARRDFTDVRDMVRAYVLLMERGIPGEVYNVGSGLSHRIEEVLKYFLDHSTKRIEAITDPAKLRPSDIPDFVADSSKVQTLTNWRPEIPFEQSLHDILEYWRSIT